jgi:hypothetical protein
MAVVHLQKAAEPTVFVTKGRQRVKQYFNNTIYLKNGEEFELEFFNSTTNKVLAKITLNGKSLGSGIVLRPGERVFLERYLDEAKKFLFETYEVNGADPNVAAAIKNNGEVFVEFFDEYIPPSQYNSPHPWSWTYTNSGNPGFIGNSMFKSTTRGMSAGISSADEMTQYSCSLDSCQLGDSVKSFVSQETGRVEKGSDSAQNFTYDSTQFNSYSTWRTVWKILPESQRPFVKEDLSIYCTSCGTKRKKSSHKFCPNCGAKF